MPAALSAVLDDARKRLLIVDDSMLERLLLKHRLREEPLEIIETEFGAMARPFAIDRKVDLILLDLVLPDVHGIKVLRDLKDDPASRSIPVIILSGENSTEEKVRALDLGAVDFVTKPFDPIELRARIRSALRTKFLTDLLELQAHLDPLTGLANRKAFFDRFDAECSSTLRRNSALSVLIADLDHFKRVNDEYGHSAGDALLKGAARVFREVARRGDLVARYGGEEFVLLAPDCDLEGGIQLAARIKEAVADLKVPFGPQCLRVTTSVGAVTINDPSCPADGPLDACSVFKKADLALYSAKNAGRNGVHIWSERLAAPVRMELLRDSA